MTAVFKSKVLKLEFPYDWSNPNMGDDLLIRKVLERGRFMDMLTVVKHYGIDRVLEQKSENMNPSSLQTLKNIQIGWDIVYGKKVEYGSSSSTDQKCI